MSSWTDFSRSYAYFTIILQRCKWPKQHVAASNRLTAFQQNSESHCKTADKERVRERRGVGGWEESRKMTQAVWCGGGGRRGGWGKGPGRQMPPLWPWHCRILIVRGHIVPTLLERCRAASPSHASIEMKWAEVWKKKVEVVKGDFCDHRVEPNGAAVSY